MLTSDGCHAARVHTVPPDMPFLICVAHSPSVSFFMARRVGLKVLGAESGVGFVQTAQTILIDPGDFCDHDEVR